MLLRRGRNGQANWKGGGRRRQKKKGNQLVNVCARNKH
jgi:hypothetical protein